MAGLGETILNTLKFAAGGEGEVQQRVLNKQTIDDNQRKLDKKSDKDVAALIDGSELRQFVKKGDPSDPASPLYTVDAVSMYQANPEVAVQFFNTIPKSLFNAQDEKGNTINVKVKGIRPVMVEDQEMFAVEVRRPDGKVAPLTRRGTSSPDDNVILMSRDDLNGLAGQRYLSMANNGALDNSSNFMREMASLTDAVGFDNARKEQALRDEVAFMVENDPDRFGVAEKRELFDMFSKLEGDELLQAAADMGIDIDAVFEEYNANRAAEGEGAEGEGARDTTGLGNSETMLGDLSKAVSGLGAFAKNPVGTVNDIFGAKAITGISSAAPAPPSAETQAAEAELNRLALEINKEKAATGNLTSPRLAELANARDEAAKKFFAAQSADEAAAAPPAAAPAKPIDPGSPANNSFKKAVDAGIAAISPQIEGLRQRATGAVPVDSAQSTISPEIMAAPAEVQEAILGEGLSPEERRAAILGALETTLAKPTGKATEYVRDYMIKNGYTSPEALGKAPAPEVMNIAFTIAANADVATSADRLKIAQSLMNFAQFGNMETTAEDVAGLQLEAGRLEQDQREFAYKRVKDAADSQGADMAEATKALGDAYDMVDTARAGITREKDGTIKGRITPATRNAYVSLASRGRAAAKIGNEPVALAYQQAFLDVFPEVVAAYTVSEPYANLWQVITNFAPDIFTREPYREMNTNAGAFRVTYDKRGNAKKIYLVTPDGSDAKGGSITVDQFAASFGQDETAYFLDVMKKIDELKNEEK